MTPPGDPRPAPPGTDLRLVPAAVAAWSAGWWASAAPPGRAVAAAVIATVAGVVLLAGTLLTRHRGGGPRHATAGPRTGRGGGGPQLAAAGLLVVAAAVVVLAAAGAQSASRLPPPVRAWIEERAVIEGSGRVTADAQALPARPSGPSRHRYAVRVRLARIAAHGRATSTDTPVLVLAGPEWARLTAGQRVVIVARLAATAPGDDVVALAAPIGPPRAVSGGGPLWRAAARLRHGLQEACAGLPADAGGLLPSLVLGDTSRLPGSLRDDLKTAGLAHVTAVSGTNVSIVAGAVLWAAAGLGLPRPLRPVSAALVVAGFVVLARPQPSVLRAAVMGGVGLLGLGLSRRVQGVPALAAAVVGLLAVDPWLSRDPGFALSCAATASLLLLAPLWTARLRSHLPLPVAAAIAVPAAAQAACGPLTVLLTPSVGLTAIPANLLAEPLVAPATVAGAIATVIAPLSPVAAHWWAWLGSLATGRIAEVAHLGAAVPGSALPWPAGPGGALLLAALTGALIALTLLPPDALHHRLHRYLRRPLPSCRPHRSADAARRPGPPRPPRPAFLVAALVLAVGAGWVLGPRVPLPGRSPSWPPARWAVVQCDVGQGSATVLRSGPDRAVLVDTGPAPGAVDGCLRRLGVRHLDLVLLTHFHADHVLGLRGAVARRDVAGLTVTPLAVPSPEAAGVRRVARAAGTALAEGWAGAEGRAARRGWETRWRLLTPDPRSPPAPPAGPEGDDGTAANEASVAWVAQVTGPGAAPLRVAGLGDLEVDGQQRLARHVAAGEVAAWVPVDALVVAHHGSARQAPQLYRALAPRVGVIGVGEGNDYGHPALSTLLMLRGGGALVRRTDTAGGIALVPGGAGRLSVAVAAT